LSEAHEFDVVFVCTGNRFRSPLAAAALGAARAEPRIRASSVGILELGPVPALPEALELARTFELDLSSHRARAISELDLAPLDLVLGFERSHVHAAVVDAAAAVERTFTLPELVLLLESLPELASADERIASARARVNQAHEARPPNFRTAPVPEIVDPLGRSPRKQLEVAEEVRHLVERLAQLLFD
jgi:low molecular weight protein-tyrosine phosphatase